ncbi:MAG: type II toxin-antitoxin system YafQ family toxin [Bacteroides sp.]
MRYHLSTTKRFDKALLLCVSRGYDISKLRKVMSLLEENGTLPQEYRPHKLKGYKGNNVWECHIEPDWLLIWEQYDDSFVLVMLSTGTHSDLFGKNRR